MENETNAQVQPQNEAAAGTEVQPNQPDATQLRINELTAEKHALARAAEAANAKADQALQLLLKMQQAQPVQQPVAQEPSLPEGLPPDLDAYMKGLLKQNTDSLTAAFQQQLHQVRMQGAQVTAQTAFSDLPTEEVRQKAQSLYMGWQANGLPYTAEDAANFALGEHQRKVIAATRTAQAGRQIQQGGVEQFVPRQSPGSVGGSSAPVVPSWAHPQSADFDPGRADAWWDEQGKNFG